VPTFMDEVQPIDGATPPEVFTRWMKVVADSVLPPVGPSCTPASGSRSQGIGLNLAKPEMSAR
jgi:hypothetical protein